ncbi:MAG: amidohydrolase [Ruminococcus sp.]|nr:amidohydrolase [Ruminococcus sp.]
MLIDFHFHAFNEKIAERAIAKLEVTCGQKALTNGTLANAVELFDKWDVDKGVLLPIATKPTQQKVINDWAAAVNSERIISFGSIHPEAEDVYDELKRIKSLGLHGIKLHPDYQQFFIEEERLDPIFDAMEALDLPVVIHAGLDPLSPDMIYCKPKPASEMIKKHPGLTVILAHLGGNECWEDSLEYICGLEGNVYIDTAYSLKCPDELMYKIIKKHGADRVLFGSDCPWAEADKVRAKIEAMPLSDREKEMIFHENAERLLKI